MREFKFRAWDKDYKVMCGVEMLGEVILKIKGSEWENREDFIVMQSTGLPDMNGVEIYEGDVLSHSDARDSFIGKVIWSNEGARWIIAIQVENFLGADRFDIEMLSDFAGDAEVIGNIFESPELLK